MAALSQPPPTSPRLKRPWSRPSKRQPRQADRRSGQCLLAIWPAQPIRSPRLDRLAATGNHVRRDRPMLGDIAVQPMIPVKDLKTARKFYEDTLGLKPVHVEPDVVATYKSGQ